MALFRHKKKHQEQEEPVVQPDAFAFDDDLESITADLPTDEPEDEEETASETPEEALARFRESHPYADRRATGESHDPGDIPMPRHLAELSEEGKETPNARKIKRRHARMAGSDNSPLAMFRRVVRILLTGALGAVVIAVAASYFITDISLLKLPESAISKVVTPVQSYFANGTDFLTDYLRKLKLRSALETAYNDVVAENEQLAYKAMLAEELQKQLASYEDLYDEITANRNMSPVAATVIGREDSNYFSTFTINKGSRDGVEAYMAVTVSGALVGYTETVKESSSTVRTIIDSDASIAALIQSSRDQGTIRGTLGVDGKALCRMYYLPEDHLPRPGDVVVTSGVGMSFPKGIPIGTVRESTRGMDSNKSFVVVEPTADFEHIEYVIVYRYQPTAEAVQGREGTGVSEYVPLVTARPYPTLRIGASSYFLPTPTPDPATVTASPTPTATPTPTPKPTPGPTVTPKPASTETVYEYQVVATGPTATPTASPSPTPTPFITYSPGDLTWEDE